MIGRDSGVRVWMVFSRSSTAIWCVSRSESFERDVKILCLNSIMARWVERDEEEDLDGVDCDNGDGDGVDGGFFDFNDFVAIVDLLV